MNNWVVACLHQLPTFTHFFLRAIQFTYPAKKAIQVIWVSTPSSLQSIKLIQVIKCISCKLSASRDGLTYAATRHRSLLLDGGYFHHSWRWHGSFCSSGAGAFWRLKCSEGWEKYASHLGSFWVIVSYFILLHGYCIHGYSCMYHMLGNMSLSCKLPLGYLRSNAVLIPRYF